MSDEISRIGVDKYAGRYDKSPKEQGIDLSRLKKRIIKREKGVVKAVDKLTKEDVNSGEDIQELDQKTLIKYLFKAYDKKSALEKNRDEYDAENKKRANETGDPTYFKHAAKLHKAVSKKKVGIKDRIK